MNGKMDQVVKKYASNRESTYKEVEWPRCAAHGCPMMSCVKAGGAPICTYHHGRDQGEYHKHWNAITASIQENKAYIDKYTNLVHTSSYNWNINAMKGWEVLPMGDDETMTGYLNRYNLFVHKKINERATEMLEHENL